MSEQVKLGKVAMTLGGDYNSSQSYDKLTCVQYDGCSWVSKKQVPEGVAPTPANTAYWQKISDRGLQGATGAPGQSYVDKELVPIVNDLTTGGSANVLSAEQGKVLGGKLAELSAEVGSMTSTSIMVDGETYTNNIYGNFKAGQVVELLVSSDASIAHGNLRLFDSQGQIQIIGINIITRLSLPHDSEYLQAYLYSSFVEGGKSITFNVTTKLALSAQESKIKTDAWSEVLDDEKNFVEGGYLLNTGKVTPAEGYSYTDFIPVTPNKPVTIYHGNVDRTLNIIECNSNKEKIDYWSISMGTTSRTITASANTHYIRFAFMTENASKVSVDCDGVKVWTALSEGLISQVGNLLSSNNYPTAYDGNDVSVFTKCLCIGDSMTAGVFNHKGGYETIGKYSYPSIFSKLTGIETTNKGVGGVTSAQWYEQHSSEDLSGYDMAIIQLGINDAIQNGGWTSETSSALSSIIQKVKSENKGIKIFVATIIPASSYTGEKYDSVSEGIRNFVTNLADEDVFLVDLAEYGNTSTSVAFNAGHLSAYGYWRLAKDYKNYISWIMNTKQSAFQYVQFIGTSLSN